MRPPPDSFFEWKIVRPDCGMFHTYWRPEDLGRLPGEISYSDAGITTRETKDLWNMPIVFLLILGLCSAEWLLRRKWGIV